ncbi:MAG TPA: DUF5655 domain-containing protein [Bryobacteraceae bacterium]|nr:DUF5655 domain-containing protein [Bryobacteraceae bacterium]
MAAQSDALAMAGPVALQLYQELLAAVKPFGPFREEVKKTSIHLVRGSAFAGVHPRKQYLLLTIKADQPLQSLRISKAEQVSRNRWHLDLKLATSLDIDDELVGWLYHAYDLCE